MFTLSKGGLTAGQAETYYEEKYSRDDYYTEERTVAGRWHGRGAERLRLEGEVERAEFRALLEGRDPKTGGALVDAAAATDKHRAGFDGTFNAPKSVSVQALVGEDARLIEAHHRATDRALAELEEYVQARQHGGRERVSTGNMVAARFDHVAARPSQAGQRAGFGPDPHLHTHVVILNVTQRPDGAWRAIEPLEIYRSQQFATAVYRSELAKEVQALGYRVEVTGARGTWELAGYSRPQIEHFSQRRADIEKQLQEKGLDGAAAAQIAAHQTRLKKEGHDRKALVEEWRARAKAQGITTELLYEQSRTRGPVGESRDEVEETARGALGHALSHATERQAVVDRRVVEAEALERGMARIQLDQVRHHAAAEEKSGSLIAIETDRYPKGAYTTSEMLALERDNIGLMKAGQGKATPIATREAVGEWARAKGLLSDQQQVVQETLTARDWITAIEGKAGSTKTTTVGAVRELAAEHGYSVRGFGPTTGSVKALESAGLRADTTAHLLASPGSSGNATREIWVIDESSLAATRQVNAILHRAKISGVSRVVFVGDQRQHHAVEAGRPIAQLEEAGVRVASLNTIRRQRDPELRRAVELASRGRTSDAIAALEEQGRIREVVDPEARHSAIAREYVGGHEAGQKTLVVSPANEERRALNSVIRRELQTRGHVAIEGQKHTILVSKNVTGAGRAFAGNYEIGDVVRYSRGSKRLGIESGGYAKVEATYPERNSVSVRTSAGRLVEYSPVSLKGVEVYREETRELAVGDRIQFRAPHKKIGVANGEYAAVARLEDGRVTLRFDRGRETDVALRDLRHVDHGYASTSHSSQGATVDRVIVNVDTERSAELVNRQQFYVSISRASRDATVYTNDKERLPRVVARSAEKTTAMEAIRNAERSQADVHRRGLSRGDDGERGPQQLAWRTRQGSSGPQIRQTTTPPRQVMRPPRGMGQGR